MRKKQTSLSSIPEIIFPSNNNGLNQRFLKWKKQGLIRKIAPRIYTSNLEDAPQDIIRKNLFTVLSHHYPNAILSHRSALEYKPTSTGDIFLTYTYTKNILLPGVTIHLLKGNRALDTDMKFIGNLYASSQERSFLENLQTSKKRGPQSKIIPRTTLEEKLDQIIRIRGEDGLNEFRDNCKTISNQLNMTREFKQLNQLLGALFTSKPSKILSSPIALARAFGLPYDNHRLRLFEGLFRHLKQLEFKDLLDRNITEKAFKNFAFYETYFSNYIEGIVFDLDDAKTIVKTGIPMPINHENSHDLLGTYKIVSDKKEMSITPSTSEELLHILKYRHALLFKHRKQNNPGEFKDRNNQAGETHFVDLNLVRGTLIKGFDYYRALKHPFAKAAYMKFMISETHPFLDGNGRMSRIMMNAELVNANHSKVLIPIVYREDYLGSLRVLSRKQNPEVYVKMLQRAQSFSHTIHAEKKNKIETYLSSCNAFSSDENVILRFDELNIKQNKSFI
ncbi:MAG: Fic family protein [Flavobacteriaceae bacterium]|nr:Fic family protein [Flavobacteriaceae bacterium]